MSGLKSIAILLPDLRPGGAESLHAALAEEWRRRGFSIRFVLRQKKGELLSGLSADISVADMQAPRVRNLVRPLVRYLRENPPNALLAAMWPLTVIAPIAARAACYSGRVVISEHAPQSLSYKGRGQIHRRFMSYSMKMCYPLADARVAVSAGVAYDMTCLSMLSNSEIKVISNPAATGAIASEYARPSALLGIRGPLILSVGTLKLVKRHDLLIRAFAKCAIPDATLCILGEGRERDKLEKLSRACGLEGKVLLPGHVPDPAPWYAHSNLFVLASDHEGFGNVIVEALEHGVPVVSTDCPGGPGEILDRGKYGDLVPVGDVDALTKAMEEALVRSHDRDALRQRAREFSIDKAGDAYLDLLIPGWRSQTRLDQS